MVYPIVTRLRAKILKRMETQNLNVIIVRDKNIEKYLLERCPRRITIRRHTVAAHVATDEPDLTADPALTAAPAMLAAPISFTKPFKNIPFGARGRKRLSLDVRPTGLNSEEQQQQRFGQLSNHDEFTLHIQQHTQKYRNNKKSLRPSSQGNHPEFDPSNIIDVGAEYLGNIDLDKPADSTNVTVQLNFLDPNIGSLTYSNEMF